MNICLSNGQYELIEKKSRFIANAFSITDDNDAILKINEIKKEHYNARHNCYAYIYQNDNSNVIFKSSDDKEPAQTAGKPILDVIKYAEAINVCIVVTRYFGGVLLGTGGLTRAYRDAANGAINNAVLSKLLIGIKVNYTIPYNIYDKILNFCFKNNVDIYESTFTDYVNMSMISSNDNIYKLIEFITLTTSNLVIYTSKINIKYIKINNQITII